MFRTRIIFLEWTQFLKYSSSESELRSLGVNDGAVFGCMESICTDMMLRCLSHTNIFRCYNQVVSTVVSIKTFSIMTLSSLRILPQIVCRLGNCHFYSHCLLKVIMTTSPPPPPLSLLSRKGNLFTKTISVNLLFSIPLPIYSGIIKKKRNRRRLLLKINP